MMCKNTIPLFSVETHSPAKNKCLMMGSYDVPTINISSGRPGHYHFGFLSEVFNRVHYTQRQPYVILKYLSINSVIVEA